MLFSHRNKSLLSTGILAVSFCCLVTLSGFCQVKIPDSILTTLKPHPRLMVSSYQDFRDISELGKKDEFIRKGIDELLRNADTILKEPASAYELSDGFRMDTRKVYSRAYTLSMAYRLTEDKKYAERLWLDLEAASRFPDWNPDHFLDAATVTHAFAIAYDWLYDVWRPEQRLLLNQQITGKGLMQGYIYYHKLIRQEVFNWSEIEHNWNLVCNGGLAMGALAIADEEPVLAERILQEALKRVPLALQHFGPDGAWNEGPGYWAYAMRFTATLLASLSTSLGTDFGLSEMNGFSKSGLFFTAVAGAGGATFNYADAGPVIAKSVELFWLANRFNQPHLAKIQQNYSEAQRNKGHWQQAPLELLWYKPFSVSANTMPLDNYFRAAEVASLRSAWKDDAWFVAFKAGDNGVNHGHLDLGSFVLDWNGERWITDLGAEKYTVPGYFGDVGKGGLRWNYYRTRAEGHNTLVVNPDMIEDQHIDAKTVFTNFKSEPAKSFGIIDLTAAYAGKISSAKRGIALIKRKQVILQDEVEAQTPSEIYWFAHTKASIILSPDKKKATLELNGKKLVAELRSPTNATFTIMDAAPLPSSPHPSVNNKNDGITKLAIHLTGIKKATIMVAFKEQRDRSATSLIPLDDW